MARIEIKNSLYKFIDEHGDTIYVGKAINLKNRLNSHNHLVKECYDKTVEVQYTTFNTEDECLYAEKYYISKLKPKYNTIHKDKELLFDIHDFDSKEWFIFNTKSSTIEEKIEKEEIEEPIDIQIENKKILLNKIEDEYSSALWCRREISEGYGEAQRFFWEKDKKTMEEVYLLDRHKILSIFPKYEEYLELDKKTDSLFESKSKIKEELTQLLKKRIKLKIGDEEYNRLTEIQLKYFIKYETFSNKDTIQIKLKEIQSELITMFKREIDNNGFYDYTSFCINVEKSFTYDRYSLSNKEWLFLVDDKNLLEEVNSTPATSKLAKEMILSIEEELTNIYGDFTQEVLFENSIEGVGALCGVKNNYPHVTLIKRPINTKLNLKELKLAVVGI